MRTKTKGERLKEQVKDTCDAAIMLASKIAEDAGHFSGPKADRLAIIAMSLLSAAVELAGATAQGMLLVGLSKAQKILDGTADWDAPIAVRPSKRSGK